MKLTLTPSLIYEVLTETADGKAFSKFFMNPVMLQSRQAALGYFMELVLSDEVKPEEMIVTLYVRYLPTGERLELISSLTYDHPGENLKALELEVYWFQRENIATHIGIFNQKKPHQIVILWPRFRNTRIIKDDNTSLLLGNQYWIWLRRKKEILRFA